MKTKKYNFPIRYLPKKLSFTDRKKQNYMLKKSRNLYKNSIYYTRKNLKSFKSKKSNHIINAQKIYGISNMNINDELEKKTGCNKKALNQIVKKGEGAYYSSGSRPNQTPQSWGLARLASAITSGKAAVIDYNILQNGCNQNSKALRLAKSAKKKYKFHKK